MPQPDTRPFNILYADDNPGDIELAGAALDEAGLHCRFFSVQDGEEALDFLYRRKKFTAGAPRPDLILFDWNMPKVNGIEALRAVKGDKELYPIPTIIFTGSTRQEDINAAYEAGANCYIVKPAHLDLFLASIQSIVHHWKNVAR